MMDNVRSLGTHHLPSVALALGVCSQYPRPCRMRMAHTPVPDHSFNELFDLGLQRLTCDRLTENREHLSVGALEAPHQFVPDEFAGDSFAWDLGGAVRPAHERAYDIRYIKP